MAVKAAIPKHFSIIVFGLTQVAIDVEVLWLIIQGSYPLHRFWHTYLGATIVAVGFALIGKPVSQWIKRLWNLVASKHSDIDLTVAVPTTWLASFTGAFIGAYSHIVLDSCYHTALQPLQPWSRANHFRGLVPAYTVDLVCIALGVIGLIWFFAKQEETTKANRVQESEDNATCGKSL